MQTRCSRPPCGPHVPTEMLGIAPDNPGRALRWLDRLKGKKLLEVIESPRVV